MVERGASVRSAAPAPASAEASAAVPPPPEAGTAHVWWARRQDAVPALERLLDEAERGRLAAYRREEDRDRFLAGCALAKAALGGYLGREPGSIRLDRTCPRCGRPHGKPRLVDTEAAGTGRLELSVSHAGDLVVVAVAAGTPVGVDVEPLDRRLRPAELARVALAPDEAEILETLETEDERVCGFLVYWTRKEAVTKAVGLGLEIALETIRVSAPGEPPRLLSWPHDASPADVALFDLAAPGRHVAALAVLGRCEAVVELDGSGILSSQS
jgi:4'-phosphopantetheinyl transferase